LDESAQLYIWLCCSSGLILAGISFHLVKGHWSFQKNGLFDLGIVTITLLPVAWFAPDGMRKYYSLRLSDNAIVALIMFVFCFRRFSTHSGYFSNEVKIRTNS
jgi:hypothetical protein